MGGLTVFNYQPQKWKLYKLKVMLQRTIREDNFEHKQLVGLVVATLCFNIAMLCCPKNRYLQISLCMHVTSPLNLGSMLSKWIRYILFQHHLIASVKILQNIKPLSQSEQNCARYLCVDQLEIGNSRFWSFYMWSGNGGCTKGEFECSCAAEVFKPWPYWSEKMVFTTV